MRKLFLFVVFLLVLSPLSAKPRVFFNYHVFFTPDQKSFVSAALQFDSGSFKYKNDENGNLIAMVEITHIFKANDSIVLADKYLLNSPAMIDSTVEDFYDIRRYSLEPGIYTYELSIKDALSGEEISGEQAILIKACDPNKLAISDIEFIQDAYATEEKNNFTKNGFFILPYLTNYFPPEMDKIAFYFEIYNANKVLQQDEPYLITYTITDQMSKKEVDGIFKFQKLKANPVTPIIAYLPINELASGLYDLNITIIDQKSDTIYQDLAYFERRSDIPRQNALDMENLKVDNSFMASIPKDSIMYFVQSLMPISPRYEYESIRKMLKTGDTTNMTKYFYAYWVSTAPSDPLEAWTNYRAQVYKAEVLFGTQIKYGFETDRGRIYLQYGAPNDMIDRPSEIGTLPYQIWRYYRIGPRSDVRFIFYNPDLVTNDYPLLHSDMQGELQNYRWQSILQDQTPENVNDDGGGNLYYGGNSNIYFTNP